MRLHPTRKFKQVLANVLLSMVEKKDVLLRKTCTRSYKVEFYEVEAKGPCIVNMLVTVVYFSKNVYFIL